MILMKDANLITSANLLKKDQTNSSSPAKSRHRWKFNWLDQIQLLYRYDTMFHIAKNSNDKNTRRPDWPATDFYIMTPSSKLISMLYIMSFIPCNHSVIVKIFIVLLLEKGLCPKLIEKCSNKCKTTFSWKFISKATGILITPDLLSCIIQYF